VARCGIASSHGLSTSSMIGSNIRLDALTWPAAVANGVTPIDRNLRPKTPAKA